MGRIVDFFKELFERFQRFIEESVLRSTFNEFVATSKDFECAVKGVADSVGEYRRTIAVPSWVNSRLEEKLSENKIEFSKHYMDDNIYFVFKNKKDVDYALSLYPAIEKEIEDNYYQNVHPTIVEVPQEMRLQARDACRGVSFSIWENLDDPNKLDLSLPCKEDADFFRTLMNENRLDELRDGKVVLPSVEKERDTKQQSPAIGTVSSDRYVAFERKDSTPSLDSVIKKCAAIASDQPTRYKPLHPTRDNII